MEAPFYVGQEVVALRDDWITASQFKKGDTFFVKDIIRFCSCNSYSIEIGLKQTGIGFCKKCQTNTPNDGKRWLNPNYFAPVARLRISEHLAITADLLQPQVEERADVKEFINT